MRRADAPRNPCRTLEDYRERFHARVVGSRECAARLEKIDGTSKWKLQYRLVRTPVPALQFESLEAEDGALDAEILKCLNEGPLRSIPIPAEIAVLSERSRDEKFVRLECHRVALNLKQDEILEGKVRMPLMKVSIFSRLASRGDSAPWLYRLWMAPFLDEAGYERKWLVPSILPSSSCQLCLGKAWRDFEKVRP